MADFMQFLRLKNLFGQPDTAMIGNDLPSQGGITGNMFGPRQDDYGNVTIAPQVTAGGVNPAIAPDPDNPYDAGQRMRELYTPEHAAQDRFNEMSAAYPKREDYHPSMLRKIGSAITAVGGAFDPHGQVRFNPDSIGMGMHILEKPYTDKLTDWKNQIGPAQTAAANERASNVNERTLAYQTVASELRQHAQDAKAANDAKKTQIAENRARVYEFKARNPGMKFDFTGPNVKIMDPISGKVEETDIPTGHMSKLDQMNLAHDNAMEEIGARGDEARKTEGVKETNRQKDIAARGDEARKTRQTPSGATGNQGKPETPTQVRVRQFNSARELYNTRPDLRQFIKLGTPGSNDFTITPPGKGFFGGATGPNAVQYKAMQDVIYGGTPSSPMASHTPTNGPNLGTEPPARTPTGTTDNQRVKVADMTGKVIGTIPAADAAKLDTTKYKVVK